MKMHSTVSNQWGIAVALRRSKIYDNFRWTFSITIGYTSHSWGWKRNPPRPPPTQHPGGI